MQPLLPITRNLMIACLAVLCLEVILPQYVIQWFALWPLQSGNFMPWQVVTYAFLHEPHDPTHLIFNMLGLYMFGVELERLWGNKRYIQFLLASAVAAAATQLAFSFLFQSYAPTIGASGAIFGLLLANGMLFPRRPIALFMIVPVEMRTAVIVFGVLELLFGVYSGSGGMVAHFAHLGGMLGGWLMILWWRHRPPSLRRKTSPVRRVK
jgi:membrane associated rhomboid family serine protease